MTAGTKARNGPGLIIVSILLVAAFGPYVVAGLRTEQIAVYLTAVLIVPLTLAWVRVGSTVAALLTVWVLFFAASVISGLDTSLNLTPWQYNLFSAGLDNLALPLMLMLIVLGLQAWGADSHRLLRRVAMLTVASMSVNTGAAILQFRGAEWTQWWGLSSESDVSVAASAAGQGRYGGLINQPAEAGLLYGMALLCVLYLWRDSPKSLAWGLVTIIVGGVMTVSKVFLLVALPLALWQIVRDKRQRWLPLTVLISFALVGYLVVQSGVLPAWNGEQQLRSLVPGQGQGALETFSATRYGASSSLQPVIDAVIGGPKWFGFGAAGLQVPYDSGLVEALVYAGLFGVACYCLVFAVLWSAWRRMPGTPERTLLGFLALLLAVGSTGISSLTANRVATVAWLLLLLLVTSTHAGRRSGLPGADRRPEDLQSVGVGGSEATVELRA